MLENPYEEAKVRIEKASQENNPIILVVHRLKKRQLQTLRYYKFVDENTLNHTVKALAMVSQDESNKPLVAIKKELVQDANELLDRAAKIIEAPEAFADVDTDKWQADFTKFKSEMLKR